ncbi:MULTISPECIES: D-glycero-beta-D-manno-heptose 1-phosphate adenylyltransferase [unclassified Arthrobacter]|uniref:D-glycero-beta-D-manno-heptose 1-phosphate adenylyltransferase n=1 Tax=unclassified Arthrobacter TaxID=235627 RepID=UPI002E0C7826|nr:MULTISPECIES: D-glycero-beta-D-manno-heptose 1-phosphate adenylyltransferase [unclassified Arthrobacter]MEC5189880.1 D-beta-D-heptose 7-phosphate kinase/D-beta-D-heptose 1-phosphate adenosyltransferase [Arthrobacter sp. MP_M4]MEC5201347.1 D-beta-D-heptose 7-phosphate kinase/D-beta-D-heptose 1-phosphate adenosyltransferase [Arthrobacter sp. MP_M7]
MSRPERRGREDSPLTEQRGLTEWLPQRLASLQPSITVVGDVMLDGWWSGSIDRLCREAPAPVVEVADRSFAPGGAANTAMNLAALGAKVRLAGITGQDEAAAELLRQLADAGVDTTHVHQNPGTTTTTKTRISSIGQVLLRLDDVQREVPADALDALAKSLPQVLQDQEAVVVCDYGAGALQGPVRTGLLAILAGRPEILVVVDAHQPHAWAELKPHLATPNALEAAGMLGLQFDAGSRRADVIVAHREELLDAAGAGALIVTLDRDGSVLLPRAGEAHRTWARPVQEKQASGAGDTFVAALTLARSALLPLTTSVDLAQAAADVAVRRPGTSVCSTADLSNHLGRFTDTAVDADELAAEISRHREEGKRIVLTNGCFDVLHRGHTRYLNQAKQLGDVLVVALNSDDSVRRLKGTGRPVNTIADRAAVVAALSCVDYVTVFETATPIPLIRKIRPEIYAKGGDYTPAMLAETRVVEHYGGRVAILDYVPEQSTTAVVERIRGAAPRA